MIRTLGARIANHGFHRASSAGSGTRGDWPASAKSPHHRASSAGAKPDDRSGVSPEVFQRKHADKQYRHVAAWLARPRLASPSVSSGITLVVRAGQSPGTRCRSAGCQPGPPRPGTSRRARLAGRPGRSLSNATRSRSARPQTLLQIRQNPGQFADRSLCRLAVELDGSPRSSWSS